MDWLAVLKVVAPQGAAKTVAGSNKPLQDKGKRKIFEGKETEQCYKFKEDPLVEKVALEIDAKRRREDFAKKERKTKDGRY